MTAKKPKRTTATLDSLATLLSHTAASADEKITALAGEIAATNESIADLKTEMMEQFEHVYKQFHATDDRLRDIVSEMAVIHRRMERPEEQGVNNAGFAKETDYLLTRVAEIEKHLGLNKKISA